jgi:cytochrome c biogenesis protein CcmG, thiol:disulfide interchange protein DsbE
VPEPPRVPLRLVLAGTVLALLAAAATVVVLSDSVDVGASGEIQLDPEGEPADPDTVAFTTFDDEVVPLASLRGEPVLVNFFASYCTPCIREMPALEAAHQAVGDRVTFLGLAMQDRPVLVLPTTVLIDADGEVVASHAGELTEEELLDMITDALGIEA